MRSRFGAFWRAEDAGKWADAKARSADGETVTGVVVAKYYYGVFLDIGRGFPALLTKVYWDDATRTSDPGVGTELEAHVMRIDDKDRYIVLAQVEYEQTAPRN